ncbi:PriCT-2 domain-containing protein [Sulfidibacter corallicola]|uniref:PriCT-2 domain-containing protein n=1 Tax=Sulfidibacter corallicola TaxID=2818388 RepID=A0A8A4TWN8_SULCO|nr:PriCT-2 domain-containing protein [Sulfidibacter corallicola]QTD50935.1 PriCT-2 domain-containing protein [Sulfidibacter corallicola]
MRFGQHWYRHKDEWRPGPWLPFPNLDQASDAECDFVSVLELCTTVDAYRTWQQHHRDHGRKPSEQSLSVPFRGPFYADFDSEDQPEILRMALHRALDRLRQRSGIDPRAFRLWFSGGKGFHLIIPANWFGLEGFQHRKLPTLYRYLTKELGLGEICDPAVYSEGRGRLWRVSWKRRPNGMRKIPITWQDLAQSTVTDMCQWSAGNVTWVPKHIHANEPNPYLCHAVKRAWDQWRQDRNKNLRPHFNRNPKPLGWTTERRQHQDRLISEALQSLPSTYADDYQTWLTVGMALHQAYRGSDEGLKLWREWSVQSPKFDARALARKWRSFNSNGRDRVTLGTLFYLARKAG